MSAIAERNGTHHPGAVPRAGEPDLVARVRQVYAEADAKGEDRPGRPALIKMLANPPAISGHQVRKAKELVDAEAASQPVVDASETPAAASTTPAPRQPPASRPLTLWPVNTNRLSATAERLTKALESARTSEPPPAAASQPPTLTSGRAPVRVGRPWAVILIAIAAGFSVWSGWVGLGEMTGYGPVQPLPGIWDSLTINSAIVLPISVEAYGAYALRILLTSGLSRRTSIYAGISAGASLVVGGAAQVAYHLLRAGGYVRAPWQVVMAVALVPVVVLALATVLAKLVSVDRQGGAQ